MTRGQLVVGWLHDLGLRSAMPMKLVRLIMDYDFQRVDEMLVETIRRASPSCRVAVGHTDEPADDGNSADAR